MDQIFSAFLKLATSENLWYLPILVILYTVWNWKSRNRFERIFLTRNVAILYKALKEVFLFIGILFITLMLNFEIENLLDPQGLSWNHIALIAYFIAIIFSTLYTVNFKQIREKQIMKHKLTVLFIMLLTILVSWVVFLDLVQLSLASIGKSLKGNFTETNQVLKNIIFDQGSNSPIIALIIFSILFYFPVKSTLEAMLQEYITHLKLKKTPKITVVLKNGKEIKECYMKNNHPGKYLHLMNKENASTQHIAINKEEIEYIIIMDENHKAEFDISITPK
ncbi:hypothetical protein [Planomicrobium sp. CPCC 101079]|uniref:hypothetical protein n=1 Tax=Planomicrobium sp. CPCC 101079 TaxID=2599618 RepID=UPI0011B4F62F|nr:hypothetical protein [Planomicrobium sp. CPCC 101079]TWT01855.1 hypothetical protein FQV28_14580 [Planomicrobium sp. CPCC 101079]